MTPEKRLALQLEEIQSIRHLGVDQNFQDLLMGILKALHRIETLLADLKDPN